MFGLNTLPAVRDLTSHNPPNPHAGDANAAKMFLFEKFKSLIKNPSKKVYEHFTTATDTGNIRHVFDAVSNILIERHLTAAGLG